ncbi:unnamed protein product [Rotaria magnacalcarata]|uniref:Rho-GAP domain-containing protein n=1 Tax=Rotaria magnacalcarata TaxID=392030 RepID=A0A816VZW4_9BILA|nr:unnamed protein product [Rotaria magnacalcarata]CAF2080614.1 unnamed protein product [Rotaria magnacalcarata]CAF2127216.1 unnamed protein product [Rotaria magnacalcarata]
MTSNRKHSLIDTLTIENNFSDNHQSNSERRWRRSSIAVFPWMNKFKPFIYGAKNDDVPDCYNRVRYIRDSCKVLSDLWKTDKDFLNKSIDNDVSKSFKEFRLSDVARSYRSPCGINGSPSILNQTIDDLIQIHDYIDIKRKEWLDQLKKIIEQARDKQSNIRQTMIEHRDNYEKAQRKLETADSNLKKFQTRSDRLTVSNFDERSRELEDIRTECEQARTLSRDLYATETYRFASEEHQITVDIFSKYLFEQNQFYNEVSKFLSLKMPIIEDRLENDELKPLFGYDLIKHCSKRSDNLIAYPIEICIRLLENSLREEGLFRLAPSHAKQKKLVAELDLQSIDKASTLNELNYDPHVAASTLKQYLRELPDCLLTNVLLSQWNQVPSLTSEQARLERISQLINQLPEINYYNLCYLVRFLSRVAEYSSENKMTPSNLAICIGCSILYGKDQSLSSSSHASISNSYTAASTILELMIIHHKLLFTNYSQQEQISKSFKSQPDLIPTEFYPKSRTVSNENLLEAPNLSGYAQPSPGTRRKNKAPPPPPSSIPSQSCLYNQQTIIGDINNDKISSEINSNDQLSNENLTGNQTKINQEEKRTKVLNSINIEESSSQSNQIKLLSKRFTGVTSSSSFSPSDRIHRRTPSGGTQLDRPGAPPPLPPSVVLVSSPIFQSKQRISFPLSKTNYEQEISSNIEEKTIENDLSQDSPTVRTTTTTVINDGVNVGKLILELNNRMAAAKTNNSQTSNNIRASSIRNSTLSSPGETTDF